MGNGAAQNNPVTFLSLAINNRGGPGLVGNEQQGAITVVNNTGSITTTGLAAIDISSTAGHTPVDLNFNQITTVNSATYGIRLNSVDFITLQGTLSGLNILSNDPDTQQSNDPTHTLLDPLRNIEELPATGQTPWWRNWVILLLGLGVLTALASLGQRLWGKWAQ